MSLTILGPFPVTLKLTGDPYQDFARTRDNGSFDRINATDIHYGNFPFAPDLINNPTRDLYLFNFGCKIPNSHLPAELMTYGGKGTNGIWALGFNETYPRAMDKHIIIAPDTSWTGREGVKEAVCLHMDNGNRRCRTHYTDTIWGEYIWFLAEPLQGSIIDVSQYPPIDLSQYLP